MSEPASAGPVGEVHDALRRLAQRPDALLTPDLSNAVCILGLCCDQAARLEDAVADLIRVFGALLEDRLAKDDPAPQEFWSLLMAAHYLQALSGKIPPALNKRVALIAAALPADRVEDSYAVYLQILVMMGRIERRAALAWNAPPPREFSAVLTSKERAGDLLQSLEAATRFGCERPLDVQDALVAIIQAIMSTRISADNIEEAARLVRIAAHLDPARNRCVEEAYAFLLAQQNYDGLWGRDPKGALSRRLRETRAVLWMAAEYQDPGFRALRDAGRYFSRINHADG